MSTGSQYEVKWHPEADAERDAIDDAAERRAILNAVAKLEALGLRLGYPHCSAVQGKAGTGLRELRPRSGDSPWRALYERVGVVFVILAVGPEAKVNKRGFNRAVRAARERWEGIEF